jgi:hypothetical protein
MVRELSPMDVVLASLVGQSGQFPNFYLKKTADSISATTSNFALYLIFNTPGMLGLQNTKK